MGVKAVDNSLWALYGSAVVLSIVELGLSAFIVNALAYCSGYRYAFALACSIWTFLAAGFLLAFPFVQRKGGFSAPSAHHERFLTPLTIALNGITMVLWLACLAVLVQPNSCRGFFPIGFSFALFAFAVVLWYAYTVPLRRECKELCC